jgi:RNA polymerase sigma factor (sigma-70 family)
MYGMTRDIELLEQHRCGGGGNAAFADLVRRHVGWVHGVARRRLRDAHVADDVAQAVFILLHRKSPRFRNDRSLVAWLHRTAWYASEVAARQERRRRRHETEAAMLHRQQIAANDDPQWRELAPMLDELIERLAQADREAVLLRYYRQMTFTEVAAAMGTTEEAARKRVDRAVDKLRRMADGKGVVMSVAVLAAVMETQVATAAPPGLVATATATALADAGAAVAASSGPIVSGISTLVTLARAKVAAMVTAAVAVAASASAAIVIAAAAPPPTTTTKPATTAPVAAATTVPAPAASTRATRIDPTIEYPKLAPFDAVKWNGDSPVVRVDDVWCELLAIDDLPVERIVQFCKIHEPAQPQKRFEEDLVQVLTLLEHPPRNERVKLTVRGVDTKVVSELHDVPMTRDHRQMLWHARQIEERRRPRPAR